MKKFLILLLSIVFTMGIAFASITNGEFKELLRTGTPEQVRGAIADGIQLDMKSSLCYALRYSTQPGIIKVLVDNGADINRTKCFSPVMGASMYPLPFSTYYKNLVTTEDLLKLGVESNNFSHFVAFDVSMVKVFVKYSNTETIQKIFKMAKDGANDTSSAYYIPKYKEVLSYLQKTDFDLPAFQGKTKADVVMQYGAPQQKTEVDKTMDVWTYYNHVGDTRYNGAMNGSSYDWGYGMSTVKGTVSGGYTETLSEKYTFVFKDGVVIKAKVNYDYQIH